MSFGSDTQSVFAEYSDGAGEGDKGCLLYTSLRDKNKQEGGPSSGTPPLGAWAVLATQPAAWRTALKLGAAIKFTPKALMPHAMYSWQEIRTLPPWRGGAFRKWMKERKTSKT